MSFWLCCLLFPVRSCFPHKVDGSYRTEGVNHIRHRSVSVTVLFLDWRVPDVQLELGGGVTLGLRTVFWLAIAYILQNGMHLQPRLALGFSDCIDS
jgi:hypothetical protein